MQTILMYVYGDITTDARVNRSAVALSKYYNVTVLSSGQQTSISETRFKNIILKTKKSGIIGFFHYIFKVYSYVKKEKPNIIYAHDYYSTIAIWLLRLIRFKATYIYDAHELIIPQKTQKNNHLKFFYFFEKKIINKVNLVICASEERCTIMTKHYNLKKKPIIIRNVSKLDVTDDEESRKIIFSLKDFFSKPGTTIVYSGVVSMSRNLTSLILAAASMTPKYKVLIVGNGNDLNNLKKLANEHSELVIHFTGTIPYKYLGTILLKCDIGYVYYPIDSLNNIYCASNKVFEYASVNLPIVANNNPTILKELETNHIGISGEDAQACISIVANNLKKYKQDILIYNQKNTWEQEAIKLVNSIRKNA